MSKPGENDCPLVVDLDGTLLKSDSLFESLVRMAALKPWLLPGVPLWLLETGKAGLKKRLAPYVAGEASHWPYREEVLALLRGEREKGREIYLATAAHRSIALAVAEHLGIFSGVFASNGPVNLKGRVKAERLRREFGERGFDYLGDSAADLPVWREARQAWLVGRESSRLGRQLSMVNPDLRVIPVRSFEWKSLARALRLHQWVKNLILLVPLFLSGDLSGRRLFPTALAFLSFSLFASGIYIVNDLADIPHDRRHPDKRQRPFAAGSLSLAAGPPLGLFCLAAGLAAATWLPASFSLVLAAYFFLTLLYSFYLKRMVILDVIVLASFYVGRILAGTLAPGFPISNWLTGFAGFIFLGLSCLKRSSELRVHGADNRESAPGRSYRVEDITVLESMASACGFCSVAILALYIDSVRASERYASPAILWSLCPLIVYWYGRLAVIVHRGELRQDPVSFAVSDKGSWFCALAASAVVALSMLIRVDF
ncbi:MAG: UbiA family prenyltransferase [Planctomycetota bacterium]|jgi:4-hydroxybenzoate polyprenyltransferase/phosphoserine phosphatase|nr:UbiA family prenyltransferase [Planctomycetota bacterium]